MKLAGLYLAIIMLISLFFSVSIYQLSTNELSRGLRGPVPTLERGQMGGLLPEFREALRQDRELAYSEAKNRVFQRLVFINAIILVAAGFLSYYLALRTLRPIEKVNESLERFTADASHELRTPISAMQSEIEVALLDPKLKLSETKEILKSNLEELARLTTLSDGLLKLAREGSNNLPRKMVELDKLIKNSTKSLEPAAKKKSITIIVSKPKKLSIVANESSLSEALNIILDNAIKYSPEKSEINIGLSRSQKVVTISVKDQGVGIKAEELPHIFDRFYRSDYSRTKSEAHGYGIGLAIANNIVQMHKGTIQVMSKPGAGSTFSIVLPVK